jgi:hypothetical protein
MIEIPLKFQRTVEERREISSVKFRMAQVGSLPVFDKVPAISERHLFPTLLQGERSEPPVDHLVLLAAVDSHFAVLVSSFESATRQHSP